MEGTELQRDKIVQHLAELNRNIEHQMSMLHVLRNGIIYGVGFVLGSTVLTTLVLSFVLSFFPESTLAQVIVWFARAR